MSSYTNFTRRSLVRADFGECAVWRGVLGNAAALHPFVMDGALDAPQRIPSGAHSSGGIATVDREAAQ